MNSKFIAAALVLAGQVAFASEGPLPVDHQLAGHIIELEAKLTNPAYKMTKIARAKLMDKEEALLNSLQASDPDGYETLRATMADRAATPEIFFRWATPDEIAADLDLPSGEADIEGLIQDASTESPEISITVHLGSQTMDATGGGLDIEHHKIASGRPGLGTPVGCRHPTVLDINHKSHKYHNAPMPYAVFFNGGAALHEDPVSVRSHGCVHENPVDAKNVFAAVKSAIATHGRQSVMICVVR